jgi:hypothetical protein
MAIHTREDALTLAIRAIAAEVITVDAELNELTSFEYTDKNELVAELSVTRDELTTAIDILVNEFQGPGRDAVREIVDQMIGGEQLQPFYSYMHLAGTPDAYTIDWKCICEGVQYEAEINGATVHANRDDGYWSWESDAGSSGMTWLSLEDCMSNAESVVTEMMDDASGSGEPEQLECHEHGLQNVIQVNYPDAMIRARQADPTVSYKLACGHWVI